MSTDTAIDVTTITPITRESDARELALAAHHQLLGLLRQLDDAHWSLPTDCADWHVADMLRHLVGAAKDYASLPALVRQQVRATRRRAAHDGNVLDACNALQVRDHAHRSPGQLVAELRVVGPRSVAGRLGLPALLRRVEVPLDAGGSTAPGMPSTLRIGHLLDVVLTRDVWLHTVDIERATGVAVERGPAFDGRLVQDVVREWAGRHGQAFELTLTGPAGGRYRQGAGGQRLTHDAVEFCRILSGRAVGNGLLAHRVLF